MLVTQWNHGGHCTHRDRTLWPILRKEHDSPITRSAQARITPGRGGISNLRVAVAHNWEWPIDRCVYAFRERHLNR